MAGDYGRFQPIYGLSIVDLDLPTAQTAVVTAKGPARKVTVQRITYVPSTYAQATISFVDSLTGVVVGSFDVPATKPQTGDGTDMLYLDWGPTGTQLSAGANLNLGVTANGAAGRLHIESYQKGPISVVPLPVFPQTAGFTK
jgi:hypothetical protein